MRLRRIRRADTGAIAVVFAVFAVVAFGFAAIVVDLGYARSMKARAQDAADSAALAGAAALYSGGTAANAASAAEANARYGLGLEDSEKDAEWSVLWDDCTDPAPLSVPILGTDCVSLDADDDNNPRRVRVQVPDTRVSILFGAIFGYNHVDVSASAVASLGSVEFTPQCAICVLGPGPHVLDNADVTAANADMSFNGDIDVLNDSNITAPGRSISVNGTAVIDETSSVEPTPLTTSDPVNNPLDPVSPLLGLQKSNPCDPITGGPGVYSGTVPLGSCTLPDGWYVITGDLIAETGAVIDGDGAQFWLQEGASIVLSDAEDVQLVVPDDEVLIYAAEGDEVTVDLFGSPDPQIVGHVRAPGGTIVGGPTNSCAIDGRIVVTKLDVDGQCLISERSTDVTVAPPDPPVLIQ